MKVVWAKAAVSHLQDIHDYISRDSEKYAKRMVDRLTAKSKRLRNFPESGQVVAEYEAPQIREVIEGPYRLIYRIDQNRVVILAVIHGACLLPSYIRTDDA